MRKMKRIVNLVAWLVLPLTLLLFAQWPLRDWIQAGSREANDLAQLFFALYVAVAITATSRALKHLGSQAHFGDHLPRWKRVAMLACIAPWALMLLWSSAPQVWEAVAHLERFPDTNNPGYFVIRMSACLLPLLALAEALVQGIRPK